MAVQRTPPELKGRIEGVESDGESVRVKEGLKQNQKQKSASLLEKHFETVPSRKTRSMTSKRMGAIPRTPPSVIYEFPIVAKSDRDKSSELYSVQAIQNMILNLQSQVSLLTGRLNKVVGMKHEGDKKYEDTGENKDIPDNKNDNRLS